jgi:phosphoribosylanthranilate isomerase
MLIQIYEIANSGEASALSAMGVDHVGVLVGDGSFPREQSIGRAREIFDGIRVGAKACALTLSAHVSAIAAMARVLQPDILHLGAAPELLSPADVTQLKSAFPHLRIMRSIPVVDENSLALAQAYDGLADLLLLDSYDPGDRQIGAFGVPHDWKLDRRIVASARIPVIVAGGLGPANVAAAIRVSHPAGVDSKTGTDKRDGSHTKDLEAVSAFIAAARAASSVRA